MIAVVLAALLSAAASPLLRKSPGRDEWLLAGLLLAASPILLAVLLLVLDRPTPAKPWLVRLVASLAPPAFVAWLDALAVTWGWWERGAAALVPLALFNLGGVLWLARIRRRLPGRCPGCGLRSLLPIGRLRWCASCGRKLSAGEMG